jgi:hypothetical protein
MSKRDLLYEMDILKSCWGNAASVKKRPTTWIKVTYYMSWGNAACIAMIHSKITVELMSKRDLLYE